MARRRRKQQSVKRQANDGHARTRNPLATRTHQSRKAGAHIDQRKEASRRACRGKVDF